MLPLTASARSGSIPSGCMRGNVWMTWWRALGNTAYWIRWLCGRIGTAMRCLPDITGSWRGIMMWRSSRRIRGISDISITRSIRERRSALFSISIGHPIRIISMAEPGICGKRWRVSRGMMCSRWMDGSDF